MAEAESIMLAGKAAEEGIQNQLIKNWSSGFFTTGPENRERAEKEGMRERESSE